MESNVQTISRSATSALGQNSVLRNTYLLLAVAMIPAVIGAVVGTNMNFKGFLIRRKA